MTEEVQEGSAQISRAIAAYIKMRDAKTEILRNAKEEAAAIEKEMEVMLNYLTREADRAGLQGFRAAGGGEAHFTTKQFVKVPDWQSFVKWVDETESWQMLEKRAAKNAVLEYVKHTDGIVPPGLTLEKMRVMEVRR